MSDINRREFVQRIGLTAGGMLVLQAGSVTQSKSKSSSGRTINASFADRVAAEFTSPRLDCGPWVYWFLLDVNVTREGITADLEAMKAAVKAVCLSTFPLPRPPPEGYVAVDFVRGGFGVEITPV